MGVFCGEGSWAEKMRKHRSVGGVYSFKIEVSMDA